MMPHPTEKVPRLTHSDLINTTGWKSLYYLDCFPQVLRPSNIPLHPSIAKSDLPFSQVFVNEVRDAVPKLIKEDFAAIKAKLGIEVKLELKPDGIYDPEYNSYYILYDDLSFTANKSMGVTVSICATNINFKPNSKYSPHIGYYEGQFPENIAKAYCIESARGKYETFYNWLQHNISDQGFGAMECERNFAIGFNNLGLDKLAKRN